MNTFARFLTLSALFSLTVVSSAAAATYRGRCHGAEVTVTATGTTVRAATGTLSISGGMADAALSVGTIPSSATGGAVSLAASALHSAVVGTGGTTRAESSMGAVGLTVSGSQTLTKGNIQNHGFACEEQSSRGRRGRGTSGRDDPGARRAVGRE
jgi:hypothetical protein